MKNKCLQYYSFCPFYGWVENKKMLMTKILMQNPDSDPIQKNLDAEYLYLDLKTDIKLYYSNKNYIFLN